MARAYQRSVRESIKRARGEDLGAAGEEISRSVWSACLLPLSNSPPLSDSSGTFERRQRSRAAASCAHSRRFARFDCSFASFSDCQCFALVAVCSLCYSPGSKIDELDRPTPQERVAVRCFASATLAALVEAGRLLGWGCVYWTWVDCLAKATGLDHFTGAAAGSCAWICSRVDRLAAAEQDRKRAPRTGPANRSATSQS